MANRSQTSFLLLLVFFCIGHSIMAQPAPPILLDLTFTNGQVAFRWSPYPAAQSYNIDSSTNITGPFLPMDGPLFPGYSFTNPIANPANFYRLRVSELNSNALLTATILNRLAYGPTPDALQQLAATGPQAYIDAQLAPESIVEQLDIDAVPPDTGWRQIVASGTATSSTLYLYLDSAGAAFIDDLSLVAGSDPGVGANLIQNADFEAALSTNDWNISTNLALSGITTAFKHSGNSSLHVVASSGGTTKTTAIWQQITPALAANGTYTLSYWYLPDTSRHATFTARLSGSGIISSGDTLAGKLAYNFAAIDDLRSWHILHAVQSQRQLLEMLLQFLENHFVTQYTKSHDYLAGFYPGSSTLPSYTATQFEYKENEHWRAALLNPQCTFQDLLRLSAESPAMIIYLDTVASKGNGSNVANENYARELLELFTFGVDNGYDQSDITTLSRAWTGWTLNLVDGANEFNPLAPRTTNVLSGVTTNFNAISNLVGVWAFNYKEGNHNTNSKTIFPNKTVPARFGPPYAGRSYQLSLPARSGTNGIQDGYDVINHLANQPFTQEFISVKLCRLFVHDGFHIGYDFTDPNLTPEGQLVRQCMVAWESNSPKGRIRAVLRTIFDSQLFRTHGGSMQKVKTPLEYTVSAIRALRTRGTNGLFTADTDGTSIIPYLSRMGGMALFDRGDPDGYPEDALGWISAGTLAERLRFITVSCLAPSDSSKSDGLSVNRNNIDPVAFLKGRLPSGSLNDAGAVADIFLSIIYPAEGTGNLTLYRNSIIEFLNTGDNGVLSSPFASLSTSSASYDSRVRGALAMLLSFQRFQEQ